MKSLVTEPLLQSFGIEAFNEDIARTEREIDQGLLEDFREVEVKLISQVRVSIDVPSALSVSPLTMTSVTTNTIRLTRDTCRLSLGFVIRRWVTQHGAIITTPMILTCC